jgi:hypothetical protein
MDIHETGKEDGDIPGWGKLQPLIYSLISLGVPNLFYPGGQSVFLVHLAFTSISQSLTTGTFSEQVQGPAWVNLC